MLDRFAAFRERVLHPGARQAQPPLPPRPGDDEGDASPRPALVVGLANPGAQYGQTRHNVGAWCVNLLAHRRGARLERHGAVDSTTIELEGRPLHLARPRVMVNVSGPPIAAEARRLGLDRTRIIVVWDDLDLPVGRLRVRRSGGHGGHNGIRSLMDALGGGEFARVRVGIDRPYDGDEPVRDPDRIAEWVLSEPPPDERARLDEAVTAAADAIELAAAEGIERAMSRFNPR